MADSLLPRIQFVLILGRQGCGKTTLAARLASLWDPWRVYVHDPWGDPMFDGYHRCSLTNPPAMNRTLVILDEAHKFLRSNGGYRAQWVHDLVWGGRHLSCSRVFVSLRPQMLNRDITSQARDIYIGHLSGSKDIEYCVREWGDECSHARGLPRGSFLHVSF